MTIKKQNTDLNIPDNRWFTCSIQTKFTSFADEVGIHGGAKTLKTKHQFSLLLGKHDVMKIGKKVLIFAEYEKTMSIIDLKTFNKYCKVSRKANKAVRFHEFDEGRRMNLLLMKLINN